MSSFSTVSHTLPSPASALKCSWNDWEIVCKSSSASGEVAVEELGRLGEVTVAGGKERWRLGQQSREGSDAPI